MNKLFDKVQLTDSEAKKGIQKDSVASFNPKGTSHENILASAGYKYHNFIDPTNGEKLYVDRAFVDTSVNKIVGVNLHGADQEFRCSYMGYNFDEIISYNEMDTQEYRQKSVQEKAIDGEKQNRDLENNQDNEMDNDQDYDYF